MHGRWNDYDKRDMYAIYIYNIYTLYVCCDLLAGCSCLTCKPVAYQHVWMYSTTAFGLHDRHGSAATESTPVGGDNQSSNKNHEVRPTHKYG